MAWQIHNDHKRYMTWVESSWEGHLEWCKVLLGDGQDSRVVCGCASRIGSWYLAVVVCAVGKWPPWWWAVQHSDVYRWHKNLPVYENFVRCWKVANWLECSQQLVKQVAAPFQSLRSVELCTLEGPVKVSFATWVTDSWNKPPWRKILVSWLAVSLSFRSRQLLRFWKPHILYYLWSTCLLKQLIVKRSIPALFKTLVRPHLEYCNTIWGPFNRSDQQWVDRFQRRATRMVPVMKNLPYAERLWRLYRRRRGDDRI